MIKAGFSLGWVSALDLEGRTIWIIDAHGYGKRFIVRADEMLAAFLETGKGDSRVRGEFNLMTGALRAQQVAFSGSDEDVAKAIEVFRRD